MEVIHSKLKVYSIKILQKQKHNTHLFYYIMYILVKNNYQQKIQMQHYSQNGLLKIMLTFKLSDVLKQLMEILKTNKLKFHLDLTQLQKHTQNSLGTLKEMQIQQRNIGILLKLWAEAPLMLH